MDGFVAVKDFVWDYIVLFVLLGAGLFFTIRLCGVQVKLFHGFKSFKKGKGKKHDEKGMSSFQALATSVAAQIGTGNLVGAATAILMGGAGAIFWMWVSGFLGMATIFAEATLAQKYKRQINGEMVGGPIFYIKGAFKGSFGKILACTFSILIVIALPIAGNMVQANSIADAFNTAIPQVPMWGYGIIIVVLAGIIFIGGAKRIVSFTEKVVPFMALLYLIGAIVVLGFNYKALGGAFHDIFVGAFRPEAVVGGVAGATVMKAMRYGVARGLFSNEAGMGSTPHAHALAKVNHPCKQGSVAMLGVFLDTFVVLTITALVILTSGLVGTTSYEGITLVQEAYRGVFGEFGIYFIAICLFFFAFSTIIAWYFFGVTNIKYLFGKKAVKYYSVIVLGALMLGASLKLEVVWTLSDLMNGLMVIPNAVALIALSNQVAKTYKQYRVLYKKGELDDYSEPIRQYLSMRDTVEVIVPQNEVIASQTAQNIEE